MKIKTAIMETSQWLVHITFITVHLFQFHHHSLKASIKMLSLGLHYYVYHYRSRGTVHTPGTLRGRSSSSSGSSDDFIYDITMGQHIKIH